MSKHSDFSLNITKVASNTCQFGLYTLTMLHFVNKGVHNMTIIQEGTEGPGTLT